MAANEGDLIVFAANSSAVHGADFKHGARSPSQEMMCLLREQLLLKPATQVRAVRGTRFSAAAFASGLLQHEAFHSVDENKRQQMTEVGIVFNLRR